MIQIGKPAKSFHQSLMLANQFPSDVHVWDARSLRTARAACLIGDIVGMDLIYYPANWTNGAYVEDGSPTKRTEGARQTRSLIPKVCVYQSGLDHCLESLLTLLETADQRFGGWQMDQHLEARR